MHRILCFLLFAAVMPAQAQLSLPDVQRRAVERSRQVAAQDAAVTASREMAVAAAQLPDPVLKLGVDNLPVNGADRFSLTRDFMTMRRIGLMQELTREKKRELRGQKFEREADKSTAEKDAAIAAIQRDSAIAWLERYYAEAMAAVLAEQAAQARTEIIAAEGAYRGGRARQGDAIATPRTLPALQERAGEYPSRIRPGKTNPAPRGSQRPR